MLLVKKLQKCLTDLQFYRFIAISFIMELFFHSLTKMEYIPMDKNSSRELIKSEFKYYLSNVARSSRRTSKGFNLGKTSVDSYLIYIEPRKLFDYNLEKWKHIESMYDFTDPDEVKKIADELLNDNDFIEHDKKDSLCWRSGSIAHYVCFINARSYFKKVDNKPKSQGVSITTGYFSIKKIIELIGNTGLIYSESLIKRFAFSLMSKRFLILSGLAGSGKTQLALAFASALVKNKEEQMCVVSVGADWTNREPLLGFPNALDPGKYVKPESGVLDLLIEANRPENADKPFFLILDEMNMSYVERYFADFLSAMESKEKINLWNTNTGEETKEEMDGVPQRIDLPNNLFIIGTINVDETTYMFSPKVLDRANVIEFKISPNEMGTFLQNMRDVNRDGIIGKAAGMGASFVEKAARKDLEKDANAITTLQNFFDELKNVNAEFGYRSATEIFRFICQANANDDTIPKMTDTEILDAAIVQKLLPKLHGSRKKLEPVLQKLWKLCLEPKDRDNTSIAKENVEKAIFKESADKIRRMFESAAANGFTSFAEA